MAYTTNCTCTDCQLELVGCDCDHTGPARIVKTDADYYAEAEAAYEAQLIRDERAMIAYFEAEAAAIDGGDFADPREDYAEYTLAAARHQ